VRYVALTDILDDLGEQLHRFAANAHLPAFGRHGLAAGVDPVDLRSLRARRALPRFRPPERTHRESRI
jgi:hypothetical protein